MNPIQRVSVYFHTMSNAERETCNKIMEHPEVIVENPIADAADYFEVSPSSILRLTKRIGYKGYTEFKYALEAYLNTVSINQNQSTIANDIINSYKSTLDELEDGFDEKSTMKLINLMKEAEFIKTIGLGNSQLPAKQLAYSFYTHDLWIESINDMMTLGFLSDNSIDLGETLFIFFSVSGNADLYREKIKKLRKKHAKIVLLTANPDSSLTKFIDLTISLPSLPFTVNNRTRKTLENRSIFYIYLDILLAYYLKA